MPLKTKENYLKSLYFLADEKGKVSLSVLSKRMGVSVPTANSMVKRLQDEGWVIYQKYKPLELTASGKKTAGLIIRKHRISEMYLVQKMGFGWEEVHDIAEDLEHIHSEELFERMDEMLGYPTVDPHGSPIPDKKGTVTPRDQLKLSEVKPDNHVRLSAITNSTSEFLVYLNKKDLKLGDKIQVISLESFDKSMSVSYGKQQHVVLSKEVCERLLVEILK